MGTGLGAAQEGQSTGELLRKMLCAGFPPDHALRSINAILALRGQAGAVTVDLAEIRLDTGQTRLYKWGAVPSWVLRKTGAEKIGTATPPPGISVTEGRETVTRLSLGRGEVLILLSDGVEVGDALRRNGTAPDAPPGELAEKLLEWSQNQQDDATAVVIRLHRNGSRLY
jgi:stage II sporulation protein E